MKKDTKIPGERSKINTTGCLVAAVLIMTVVLVLLKLANMF